MRFLRLKLDEAIEEIKKVQAEARKGSAEEATQAIFPVLVARIPKGWTGPKSWEGTPIEGGFRAHRANSRCSPYGSV